MSAVTLGMLELIGRLHAQTGRTAWDAISIALEGGMAVRIQGNGRDAATESARLIRIPSIEGGISGDVERKEAQDGSRLEVEGRKVGHIGLVERQGTFGQHDVPVVGNGGDGNAGAVAPQIFLDLFGRAVGLLLIAAGLDAHAAIAITFGLAVLAETVLDVLARVVFAHPGINVLHVVGDGFAQAGDLLEQCLHGGGEQSFEHTVIERALLVGEPAGGFPRCAVHQSRRAAPH